MQRLAPLLLALLAAPLTAAPAAAAQQPGACATLDSCIAEVTASAGSRRQIADAAVARIAAYGDAAVDRLVPLLADPDPHVRESAALALRGLPRIDPRHLPAMVGAWRGGDIADRQGRGNGWMPLAIALTGTDEALRLLWADLVRNPDYSANTQTFFALARFGDRLRPLVAPQLQACAASWSPLCRGIIDLLSELGRTFPPSAPHAMPDWALAELVRLIDAPAPEASETALWILARRRHPAALAPLQRLLAALPAETAAARPRDWQARDLISTLSAYGEAARASGGAIARFLGPSYPGDLRAAAALAIGRVGDPATIDALAATAPAWNDDWLLAYNAAESLGRLRAAGARPLLERLMRDHWHRAVRNNAARALSMIAGGPFARSDLPGDGAPPQTLRGPRGEELFRVDSLRYAGDDLPRSCARSTAERTVPLSQDPVGRIAWPRQGVHVLEVRRLDDGTARDLRAAIPPLAARGSPVAHLTVGRGDLIAFNGGEFGGGLYLIPESGAAARPLLTDPVVALWQMGGKLYAATGLDHLGSDWGTLYVIDPRRFAVERRIRLPASPTGFAVSSGHAAIVSSGAGDIAIREDGRLVDAALMAACAASS